MQETPSIEDLIGSEPETHPMNALQEIHNGVSVTWLMQAFKMDRQTVRKKLAPCPPIRMGRGNTPLYDFSQAASFLVKPRVNIDEYIRSIKPSELPPLLQKEFWDAKLKRQKWEVQAKQLWKTSDVLEVFGETFKLIKTTMNLWVDTLDRVEGMTPKQRAAIVQLVDGLQDEIHSNLVRFGEERATPSAHSELEHDLEEETTDEDI